MGSGGGVNCLYTLIASQNGQGGEQKGIRDHEDTGPCKGGE